MNIFKSLQQRCGEGNGYSNLQNSHHENVFIHDVLSNQSILQRFSIEDNLKAHNDSVNTICFDETGNRIASGSNDGKVVVWDLSKAKSLKKINSFDFGSTHSIHTTNFLPKSNSDMIMSGGDDQIISLSSVSQSKCLKKFSCHRSPVWKVEVEKNNPNVFLSASEDSTVRLFDLRESHVCGSYDSRCNNILVDLRKENKRLYNGNGISITTFSTLHIEIYSLAINPINSNYFVIGGNDPIVRLFDRRMLSTESNSSNKATPVYKWIPGDIVAQSHRNTNAHFVTGLNWNHDGSKIAASFSGNQIFILDGRISKIELTLENTKKRKSHNNKQESKSDSKQMKKEESVNNDIEETSITNDISTMSNDNQGSSENSIRGYVYARRLRSTSLHDNNLSRQDGTHINLSPESIRPIIYSNVYSSPIQLRRDLNNQDVNTPESNQNGVGEIERNDNVNNDLNERDQNILSIGRWLNFSRRREFIDSDLKVIAVCKGHKNIESVSKNVLFWGPESQYVISGSDDGSIFIWDIQNEKSKIVNILSADSKSVCCIAFHPRIAKLISSGKDHDVKVWSPILSDPSIESEEVINKIVKKNEIEIKEHMEIRSRLPRVMVNIIQLIWPTQ